MAQLGRSASFLDLVDLVGDEAVRLAMDGVGGLRVGGFDQAEGPPGSLVDPIGAVVNSMFALLLDVRRMSLRDVLYALGAAKTWSFRIERSYVASDAGATVQTGAWRAGGTSALAQDDNLFYEVRSTTNSPYTTAWCGTFTQIPNALTSLNVTYSGKNAIGCSQTIAAWRTTTGTWVTLDSRTVGSTEVRIDKAVASAWADYVSGTTGAGNVNVRVRCTTSAGSNVARADPCGSATHPPELTIVPENWAAFRWSGLPSAFLSAGFQ